MELQIKNKQQLNDWLYKHRNSDLVSIRGPAPLGATYEDGTPIVNDVNIGWGVVNSTEVFNIEYFTE
jgi:hypothetical protein